MEHYAIDHYIERYYSCWYKYTRYMCNYYGIKAEAYDIFMNVMLQLLEKRESDLTSLIEYERAGSPKLRNYTKVMIKFNVLKVYSKRACVYSIDDDAFFSGHSRFANEPEINFSDASLSQATCELDNEKRIAESRLRDDSIMTPFPTQCTNAQHDKVRFSVYRNVPQIRKTGYTINYIGEIRYKNDNKMVAKRKYFQDKALAMQWSIQTQNAIANSL